jgi:predicted thioesterase
VDLQTGITGHGTHRVSADDTALALGSGDVEVLGTPRLIAWLEAATLAALHGRLAEGQTSVGVGIDVAHRAPSAVGDDVQVEATLVEVRERTLRFDVVARDTQGAELGTGTITRVVVPRSGFAPRG